MYGEDVITYYPSWDSEENKRSWRPMLECQQAIAIGWGYGLNAAIIWRDNEIFVSGVKELWQDGHLMAVKVDTAGAYNNKVSEDVAETIIKSAPSKVLLATHHMQATGLGYLVFVLARNYGYWLFEKMCRENDTLKYFQCDEDHAPIIRIGEGAIKIGGETIL